MNYMIWLMDKQGNSRLVGREVEPESTARELVRSFSGPGLYAYAFRWENGTGHFAFGSLEGDEPIDTNLLPLIRKMRIAEKEEKRR